MRPRKMSRAADREAYAKDLADLAQRVGATIERDDSPREIVLNLYRDGAGCMVILNGDEPPGLPFMAHWHFQHSAERKGRLWVAGFDGLGYRPHHKATSMADNGRDLLTMIEARFRWIADGSAFTEEATA